MAGVEDRIVDRFSFPNARFVSKVDHDDPVFHHNAEQHDHSYNSIEGKGLVKEHQTDEPAESCRWEGRHHGERRKEALIQNAKNDVYDEEGDEQEELQVGKRLFKNAR